MHDLDDQHLSGLIRDQDPVALSEVYSRHRGPVYGLALRLVRDRELAEDVTQEVFLRLWNRPEAYDPDRGSLRSYLLSHAHGRSIDLIRSEGARRRREERELQLAPARPPTLEEEVMDLVRAEQMRDALQTLNEKERDAIELAYFGGLTYREVAALLGEPEGTVKSRIRVGLKRLHGRLTGAGVLVAG